MKNSAQQVNNDVAATVEEPILSEELRQVVIEREKYAENNPDCWIDYEQAMRELRNL